MATKTGRFAIIEQLLADDIHYMFGNPGTVEQGFLDALENYYPGFQYILTLQETIAVAMADGYARATKKPTIVQLHSGVGLGNGIGMLYQAKRGHAPLVVLNGDAGIRYDAMDAQMAADVVAMAEPVTKWATRVIDPSSLLRVLRRALKIAATPPMGPVFVCLPMDILDAPLQDSITPTSFPITRAVPENKHIIRAAELLASAQAPLFIIGDGIAAAAAQQELTNVAELVGADVWGADSSEVNMSATHPLFRGQLGHMFGEHSRAITSKADVVLICGTYVFPEVFPALAHVFDAQAKVIHVDLDAYEIAKNFPVELGLVSDPQLTLAALAVQLEKKLTTAQRAAANIRLNQNIAERTREIETQREANKARHNTSPLHPSQFMAELSTRLALDAVIFDEALTTSPDVVFALPPTLPGHYFLTRGGSLGVGLPGALGLKLANPDKVVLGFSGDGGSMYTIQALWTAARHNIGAKFIVCNNHSYRLLNLNIQQYWRDNEIPEHEFPHSFDLHSPEIRFDELARALGVPAVRVETAEQIGPALRQALADDLPFLIDLVITAAIPDHLLAKAMHTYGLS